MANHRRSRIVSWAEFFRRKPGWLVNLIIGVTGAVIGIFLLLGAISGIVMLQAEFIPVQSFSREECYLISVLGLIFLVMGIHRIATALRMRGTKQG